MTAQGHSSCRIYQPDGEVRIVRPIGDPDGTELDGGPPRRATEVPVTSIMTRDVICAQRTLSINLLVPLMVRNHIGSIPVVDERGKPIGMVTKLDLIEQFESAAHRTAEEVMMPLALTLNERATVAHAATMMSLEDVHHVPVVTASGAVMGIVSSLDIVRWLVQNEGMGEGRYADA